MILASADPAVHVTFVLAATAGAILAFASDRLPFEAGALAVLVALLVWFGLVGDAAGLPLLEAGKLLQGFANPSLLGLMALLVLGQALIYTGALGEVTRVFVRLCKNHSTLAVPSMIVGVAVVSAFLNNTPVVILFIPILQSMAGQLEVPASRLMMPLSFAAILGGMTTQIGSSTNMLVASTAAEMGLEPIGFFDVTLPGLILAGTGLLYVTLILPKLLPARDAAEGSATGVTKQFIGELHVDAGSWLVGKRPVTGHLPPPLRAVTVRLIVRGSSDIYPPFDDIPIAAGDILIVMAAKSDLADAVAGIGAGSLPEPSGSEDRLQAELMVAPASRMIDRTVDMIGFYRRYGCAVLGLERRGRRARRRLSDIRLAAGDVLLVAGRREQVDALADNPDMVLMTWATRELPRLRRAPHALAIFAGTVLSAAVGLLDIPVAALAGVTVMLATGCLNIRQAARALDRQIYLLVGASLALSAAMQVTGAAELVAGQLIALLGPLPVLAQMTAIFCAIAVATNIISNNACGVLFTPIAVTMAATLGVAPQTAVLTVILAANCAFATPIGYQTNLLVMGPGRYRFLDYVRGGAPLILCLTATYALVGWSYFDL